MMKESGIINALWKFEQCPFRTGIYRSDDTAIWLDAFMSRKDERGFAHARILDSGRVERGIDGSFGIITDIIQTNERMYPELDLRVSSGEGGHGSEGFIAVSTASNDNLVWLAYFQLSNPFVSASLEGDEIVAISNLDEVWHLPLDHPEGLFVKVKEA